jgi:hypothetical protein
MTSHASAELPLLAGPVEIGQLLDQVWPVSEVTP